MIEAKLSGKHLRESNTPLRGGCYDDECEMDSELQNEINRLSCAPSEYMDSTFNIF
jgi:hypothetical protein